MATPIIAMERVHKRYRGRGVAVHALRGVDLTVADGEFLAIVGPSGSGKTTLMNIIGCLDMPDTGSYRLNGEDVGTLGGDALARVRNATIGFVFQNFNLLPRSSALENVETPLMYARRPHAERQDRAKTLLTELGLGDRLHHLPSQLSGGQHQRVAIARALVNQPSILIADEPTGNLDTVSGEEVLDLLAALNRDEGVTVIVITHEPGVAERARRTLTLRDGRLEV